MQFLDQLYRPTNYCINCDEQSDLMYEGVCIECRLDPVKK
ncbi:MAG: hypothetical protein JWO15_3923 [Sphingomonadales bacterium]|nr:hypothetical protein [Sphingomonadales bacterium]